MADGWISIGTKLNNKKLDQDIESLQRKIDNAEKDNSINLEAKVKAENSLNEVSKNLEKLQKEAEKTRTDIEEMNEAMKTASAPDYVLLSENLVEAQGILKQQEAEIEGLTKSQNSLTKEVERTSKAYRTSSDKVQDLQAKMDVLQAKKNNFGDIGKNIGDGLEKAAKKAAKLAIGIFSIRSAYSAMRRASSELAGYDDEYSANLEYIRFVLTQAIAPVLRGIVQIVATLLGYIYKILNAWFGWNIDASKDAFANMKKSSGGIAKNMKEASKSAQSFDELNTLQDTSEKGGESGMAMPSVDVLDAPVPEWLQWIMDNGPLIAQILGGIGAAIVALKLGLGGIKALGIGIMVAGIIGLIQSLMEYIKDPSWENFGSILQNIGLIIAGLGLAIGNIPMIIAGVIGLVIGLISKHWEDIKKWFNGVIDGMRNFGKTIRENCGDFLGDIWDSITDFVEGLGKILGAVFETIKGVFDGIIKFFTGVFSGDWEKAWEGIKQIFGSIWEGIKKIATTIFETFQKIFQRVIDGISSLIKNALNALFSVLEGILNLPIKAINGLIWVINLVPGVEIPSIPEVHLPRLKTGGIINQPGTGVNIGGAIAGEAGREGVIPLTDAQAMETLGESIGRYVTINATITNNMDGKLISRQVERIQGQRAFAGNF